MTIDYRLRDKATARSGNRRSWNGKRVPISRPQLPDIHRFKELMDGIWERRQLSNWGPFSQEFQEKTSEYLANPHVRVTTSCDTALVLLTAALGVAPGKKALVPSFTFNATVNALVWNGLEPVFYDLDASHFGGSAAAAEALLDQDTGLIVATHIFGNPCEVDDLLALGEEAGVPVLFDAAHAYGALYKGRKVGGPGENATFSFSATKVTTAGEGGLMAAASEEVAERLGYLRNYGFIGDYNAKAPGLNGRISELNALMASLSVDMTEELIARRELLVERYRENLSDLAGIRFQEVLDGSRSTWNYFAVLLENDRDGLAARLAEMGIETRSYFFPAHLQDAYSKYSTGPLPATTRLYSEILCLPLFDDLELETVDFISEAVWDYCRPTAVGSAVGWGG